MWDGLRRVEVEIHRLGTSSLLPPINNAVGPIVAAGGKRLRAGLTLSGVLALGGSVDASVITAAACVELIHAASLVHDDLMDEAEERRGVRTVNASSGVGPAVLVGDFMLARAAFAALTSVSRPVAEELSATVVKLVEGQYLELADLFTVDRSVERALESVRGKTGSLFRASCVVAGRCVDAPSSVIDGLAEYGENFGMAFQILDDLLDLVASAAVLGKPVGNDLRQGVYSVPVLRLLDRARGAEPVERLRAVRAMLAERGHLLSESDVDTIQHCLRDNGLIDDTLDYCAGFIEQARKSLPELVRPEIADTLRELPGRYLNWTRSVIEHSIDGSARPHSPSRARKSPQ